MLLCDALDISEPLAVGTLCCFWLWALDNAPDGELPASARTVAAAARWNGSPSQLVDAMKTAGYIEEADGTYIIHDWLDYAGRLISQRKANAQRMRDARAKHKTGTDATPCSARAPHDTRTDATPCDARAPATNPTNQPTNQGGARRRASTPPDDFPAPTDAVHPGLRKSPRYPNLLRVCMTMAELYPGVMVYRYDGASDYTDKWKKAEACLATIEDRCVKAGHDWETYLRPFLARLEADMDRASAGNNLTPYIAFHKALTYAEQDAAKIKPPNKGDGRAAKPERSGPVPTLVGMPAGLLPPTAPESEIR